MDGGGGLGRGEVGGWMIGGATRRGRMGGMGEGEELEERRVKA